jgi:hypothetical protein
MTDRPKQASSPVVSSPPGGRLRFAAAAGGVAFLAIQLVVGYQIGQFQLPGGEVLLWSATGDALLAGTGVYSGAPGTESFYYAPPWAVFFAAFSWLGPVALQVVIWVIDVACLRYLAGSWLRVGYLCWMPLMAFEIASGQTNLTLALGIVAAIRGSSALAVPGALAKLSPILAVRDPRPFLLALAIAVAITLPWLGLWPDWISKLTGSATLQIGNTIPVPLPIRLVAAAALLAVRRPTATALAATIAIPAFHWASLVVLVAPLVVWAESRWPAARTTPAAAVISPSQAPAAT